MGAEMRSLVAVVAASVSVCLFSSANAQTTSVAPQASPPVQGPTTLNVQPGTVPPWMTVWSGGTVTNSFVGGYVGAVASLNQPRNLWADGPMLRFEGSFGSYKYNSAAFPNLNVEVQGAAMMFGYRQKIGEASVAGYLGAAYEAHGNPDPAANVRGLEGGIKTLAELYSPLGSSFDFYLQGRYSTVFSSWGGFGRLGYRLVNNIWIGPEATVMGSGRGSSPYREGSVGGFVRVDGAGWQLAVSGGYRQPLTSGPDGYYAGIYFGYDFN